MSSRLNQKKLHPWQSISTESQTETANIDNLEFGVVSKAQFSKDACKDSVAMRRN